MDDTTGLLPGTLDLLILKAVSLGTLHGYGVLSASSKSLAARCRSSRARSIRPCTAWNAKGSSTANGARWITAAPSSQLDAHRPGTAR